MFVLIFSLFGWAKPIEMVFKDETMCTYSMVLIAQAYPIDNINQLECRAIENSVANMLREVK